MSDLTYILVGCGATKQRDEAHPERTWPARDLYCGSLFRAHRDILASAGLDLTHVLSARYNALRADREVSWYEMRMSRHAADRHLWGALVLGALRPAAGQRWLVLAGAPYVDPWADEARRAGAEVLDPLRGLVTGARLALAKRVRGDRGAARAALGLEVLP